MGGRTILTYVTTTLIAVTIGLILVNSIQPGKSIRLTPQELVRLMLLMRIKNGRRQANNVSWSISLSGYRSFQYFAAQPSNRNMLQIIFFALFWDWDDFIARETAQPVKAFFDSFNAIILKLIDMIMMVAPYGVFALLAALVVEAPSLESCSSLGLICCNPTCGLAAMISVYALIVRVAGRNPSFF